MTTGADTVIDIDIASAKRCPECASRFGRDAAFCPFDGSALQGSTWDPTGDPLTKSLVAGRYDVIEPLGEGGMGTVYKVRHMTLDRFFAMKVLRRELAKDPALSARFMQEARATAAIHHPSIVAINDFGVLDDGAPYFVMEMLVGETLATYLHARGLLPPRTAAAIARRIAEALEAAHKVGVVHRDLKPENVFLVGAVAGKAPSDDVRIVDFGAAKIIGKTQLTRPGVVFGTPYYMSPEQASGGQLDGRADVYSLGVLLYEMITGSLPFEADTYMGVLTKHMFESPTRPSVRAAGVQLGALEDIVMRALEKEPNDRYRSMRELADALNRGGGMSVAPRGTQNMPNAPPIPLPAPLPRMSSERPDLLHGRSVADKIESSVARHLEADARRQRRLLAIGAVCVIGAIGVLGLARSLTHTEDASLPLPARAAPLTSALTTMTAPVPTPTPTPEPNIPPPEPATAPTSPPAELAPAPPVSASVSAPRAVTSPSRPGKSPPPTTTTTFPPTVPAGNTNAAAPAGTRPSVDDLPDPWRKSPK